MEAGGCSETLVIAYHTTRLLIPEDCDIKIVNILDVKRVESLYIHAVIKCFIDAKILTI
jgi:hypothetical protein